MVVPGAYRRRNRPEGTMHGRHSNSCRSQKLQSRGPKGFGRHVSWDESVHNTSSDEWSCAAPYVEPDRALRNTGGRKDSVKHPSDCGNHQVCVLPNHLKIITFNPTRF